MGKRSSEEDVQPFELDELEALRQQNAAYEAENEEIRKLLGEDFVYIDRKEIKDSSDDEMVHHHDESVLYLDEAMPSWSKKARVERALEVNIQLQDRVKLLLSTVEKSRVSHDAIQDMLDLSVLRKRKKASVPHTYSAGNTKMEYSGKSWFWAHANCETLPSYKDASSLIFISKHLPLVNRSGAWTPDECESLRKGVEEIAKERMTNEMLKSVDTIEEFEKMQRPMRSLSLESPKILEITETFTDGEWATLATRHLASRTGVECKLQWINRVNPSIKDDHFSQEENKKLLEYVEQHGEHSWGLVAEHLPGRVPIDCLRQYEKIQVERQQNDKKNIDWTQRDISKLQKLVAEHGQAWKRIESEFGGAWPANKLMYMWRKHQQGTEGGTLIAKKGPWSKDEDEMLLRAVAISGKEWSKVAKLVSGRTEVQCRERYVNHLDPNVQSEVAFTKEERDIVVNEVAKYTGRIPWAKISKLLPGRTDRQCRKVYQKIKRDLERAKKKG